MCTNIKLRTKNNTWITGRTNEFSGSYAAETVYIPRNYSFKKFAFREDLGKINLKYAMVGQISKNASKMNFDFDDETFEDGMNEFGLSVAYLFFPIIGKWTVKEENELKESDFSGYQIANILLGLCKTTQEVREFVEAHRDDIVVLKNNSDPVGLHLAIVDKNGDSIVLEPINGKLIVKENPMGVMTNSPQLEWHIENLANYLNLNPIDTVKNDKFYCQSKKPIIKRSMGSGARGLPGDWTATSRFIRVAFISQNANVPATEIDAVNQCFRILHTSDIVEGSVVSPVDFDVNESSVFLKPDYEGNFITDVTDNTIVKDLENKVYYWTSIDNLAPRYVKLNDYLQFNEVKRIPINSDNSVQFQKVELH